MLSGRNTLVAVLVVIVAFAVTWFTLGYISQKGAKPTPDYRSSPEAWSVIDSATYEVKDGVTTMHGPQSIYREAPCEGDKCTANLSLFVMGADQANLAFLFLNGTGEAIQEATVKNISGVINALVSVEATAPPGTQTVRALVYAPTEANSVVFRDVEFRVGPVQ